MIYAAILFALVNSAERIANGTMTIGQALIVLMLSYSYFASAKELMNASHSALTAIAAAGKVEEIRIPIPPVRMSCPFPKIRAF
ncbi:MAG: hypothetical protein ACLUD2_17620 [Clostridium sp.]